MISQVPTKVTSVRPMIRIPQTIHGNSKTDGSTCGCIRNLLSKLKLKFAFWWEEYKARKRQDQEEKSAEDKGTKGVFWRKRDYAGLDFTNRRE
jgi:hypothetical protein